MTDSKVSIRHCNSYNKEELIPVIEEILSTSDFPDVDGKSVFLKPNILSDAKPEDCITTNPDFLAAVIRVVKARGASSVLVGDSPGLPSPTFCARSCGIAQVCQQEGAEWVDFFADNETVKIPGTKQSIALASIVRKADIVISLPKFKTHQLMYATGGVKNLFGLVPGLLKSTCHLSFPSREAFAKFICGIYQYVKPDYCLMDAVIGMEGPGPANGTPRAVGLVIGGTSCAAVDYTEALIMGYKPNSLPIIRELKVRSLLSDKIDYPLMDAYSLIIDDYRRIPMRNKTQFFKTLIIPFFTKNHQKRHQKKEEAPQFIAERCIRCLRCVKICPPKALTLSDGKIVDDLDKCIRCYCCHEVCPEQAIKIPNKTGGLNG